MIDLSNRVLIALGYSLQYAKANPSPIPESVLADPDTISLIGSLLDQMDELDAQMASVLTDSMAVQVADIKLDYAGYLSMALGKGNRLLYRLSALTGIPINANGYTMSGAVQNPRGGQIAVRNYY